MKQQLNVRISKVSRERLNRLAARYGTVTSALEIAIDRMWREEEFGRPGRNPEEVWPEADRVDDIADCS